MAFCIKCGKKLDDEANFCANCGTAIHNTFSSNGRKTVYDGEIHKCPNCGEIIGSFITNCLVCGYELRGVNSSNNVQEFAARLDCIQTESKKISFIGSFPVPNTKEDIFEFLILASTNIS